MFRFLCFMLFLILSLGNVLRLEKLGQIGFLFWFSSAVLLFSAVFILIATAKAIKALQKPKRIRLSDLKKYDDLW